MLIKISVENYKSFEKREELSMISSSKIRKNGTHKINVKQVNLLKNAVIYGANASGKSNLVKVFAFIKASLTDGLPIESINLFCKNNKENKTKESYFELQFTVGDKFYAYGFTAILSQRKITSEWLYELLQSGNATELFERTAERLPTLGEKIKLGDEENNRFNIYAEDFAGHESKLFLSEMNHGKKYSDNSHLLFFKQIFEWIMNNIIVLSPNMSITNTSLYLSEDSLESISQLIQTFDTGITQIKQKPITIDELSKMIPAELLSDIFDSVKKRMQADNFNHIEMTWKMNAGFFNFRIEGNHEPEITALVLKHGKSWYDFDYSEESDGTKRLFDLVDMLVTKREDTVYIVDELERSLHPKLTEHFLQLFMKMHEDSRMQLIFTTHEDTIMDQELFRRDEIWFIERDANNSSKIYSLDRFKERYDKVLSKAYLDGRYGAIPVFKKFALKGEE